MHTLYLKAADSRCASEADLREAGIDSSRLPPDPKNPNQPIKLRMHQVKTIRELRDGTAPILVNTAMTGDGKSLIGQFRLWYEKLRTFTMYPTNELIVDQWRSLDKLLSIWTPPAWGLKPLLQTLDAQALDEMQTGYENGRADALEMLLNRDAVLTNPDIFHLIMQARYKRPGAATDTVLGYLAHKYDLFVFDEFHLFGSPQVASVMIALLLLQEITAGRRIEDRPRALFLSATPQPLLAHLAAKTGLGIVEIKGNYEHGGPEPDKNSSLQRILQPVTLRLYDARMEDWITEHLEDVILRFFSENRPGAQGVIIVNSVATAYRVYNLLMEPCRRAGIYLPIPNTGLTPRSQHTLEGDLIIATSTIDVGVDFRINLLIFESTDAATHIQRLGRLGRHTDDGKGHAFTQFEAHGLLRQWVIDGIAKEYDDAGTLDREEYRRVVEKYYPPMQQFHHYVERWGSVQARHILDELRHGDIKTQYDTIRERLFESYKPIFPRMRSYVSLNADKKTAILNEAISFRGGSPFTALVLDRTQPNSEVIPYNLITLLVNAELEEVRLDKLYDYAAQRKQYLQALKRNDPLIGYYRHGWLDKPRRLGIRLNETLPPEQTGIVVERTGFRIDLLDGPQIPELSALNKALEGRKVVALLLPNERVDGLRQRWHLGQLELFPFCSADGIEGTAAFGRDALLLDSIVNRFPKSNKRKSDDRPFLT